MDEHAEYVRHEAEAEETERVTIGHAEIENSIGCERLLCTPHSEALVERLGLGIKGVRAVMFGQEAELGRIIIGAVVTWGDAGTHADCSAVATAGEQHLAPIVVYQIA